jgi:hypothetical protein
MQKSLRLRGGGDFFMGLSDDNGMSNFNCADTHCKCAPT